MPRIGKNPIEDLNNYFSTRENTVKLCNEVSDDYYEDIIIKITSPNIEKKVEINRSTHNKNDVIYIRKIYEPEDYHEKSYSKKAS